MRLLAKEMEGSRDCSQVRSKIKHIKKCPGDYPSFIMNLVKDIMNKGEKIEQF